MKIEHILFAIATVSLVSWGVLTAVRPSLHHAVPEKEQTGDWCYLKTIKSGESFGELSAGEYEYQIMITTTGVKVFVPCK